MLKLKYKGGGTIDHLKKCYGFKPVYISGIKYFDVEDEHYHTCIRITPNNRIMVYDLKGAEILYDMMREELVERVGE